MSDLYHKKYLIKHGSSDKPISSKTSMKIFLEKLAIDEHISALTGSSEIHQWSAHNARYLKCLKNHFFWLFFSRFTFKNLD